MSSSGDGRYGDRWRERESGYGRDGGRGCGHPGDDDRGRGHLGDDDRGFLNRAGDELRSWFGDDEAQRRREADQRRWEQEQRMTGSRDNDYRQSDDNRRYNETGGGGGFGGGWGNQRGDSWHRDRPGERSPSAGGFDQERGGGRHYGRGEREGWFSDSQGGERGDRPGGSGGRHGGSGEQGGGFGGETLRGQGGGYGGLHDPHYSQWRQRQIEDLDRDYEEYRREHQSKFEAEFGSWRSQRQTQRQSLGKVAEHMEVVGSDGSHVGTVDKVRGDRIVLARSDPDAGGVHHSVPCSWVERVEDKVTLNRSAADAKTGWQDEERSRALFERENPRGEGPHNLNRSFSGTYDETNAAERREDDRRD